MPDKEIEINRVYGESTKITLNISTLAWIIGILLFIISTLATMGYFDIKNDVKNQKSIFDSEKIQYKEEIRELLREELQYERDKREKMNNDIGEIKGDIKVILEKTRNLENGQPIESIHTSPGIPDSTSIPIPQH